SPMVVAGRREGHRRIGHGSRFSRIVASSWSDSSLAVRRTPPLRRCFPRRHETERRDQPRTMLTPKTRNCVCSPRSVALLWVRPHVMVLDDIHAADKSSLLLLRFLGERLSESRILVVAAYREREARVRGREGLFGELARTGSRIPVHGLNPSEVATYVATVT